MCFGVCGPRVVTGKIVMPSLKLFVFVCAVLSTEAAKKYCEILCGTNKHTMCQYSGIGASCGGAQSRTLSNQAKEDLLNEHNTFRSKTARGKLNLPNASNMKKMYWDDELEKIAQVWANQCTFGHDSCRSLLSNEQVGQNINVRISESYVERPNELNGWKNEAKDVTDTLIDSYGPTDKTVGHFTQMVWASSDRLGCAMSVYLDAKSKTNELLVCNYAAAGNWQGRPVYKVGQPCTNCLCSKEFEGLCVRNDDPDVNGDIALVSGALILIATQLIVLLF